MGKTKMTYKGKPVFRAKNGTYYIKDAKGKAKFIKAPQGAKAKKSAPKKSKPKTSKKTTKKKSQSKPKSQGGRMQKTSMLRRGRQLVVGGTFAAPSVIAGGEFVAAGDNIIVAAGKAVGQVGGYNQATGKFDGGLMARRLGPGAVATGVDIVASKVGVYKHLGNLFK